MMNPSCNTVETKVIKEEVKLEEEYRSVCLNYVKSKRGIKKAVKRDATTCLMNVEVKREVKEEPIDNSCEMKVPDCPEENIGLNEDETQKSGSSISASSQCNGSGKIDIPSAVVVKDECVASEELRDDETQVSTTVDERIMDIIRTPIDYNMSGDEQDTFMEEVNEDENGESAEADMADCNTHEQVATSVEGEPTAQAELPASDQREPITRIRIGQPLTKNCPYNCLKCDKKYKTKQGLQRHNMVHSVDKPFCCLQCDMKFYRMDHLTSHMRSHDGKKSYSCTVCEASFARKSDLNRHALTHSKSPSHSCKLCGHEFRDGWSLKCHLLTHKGSKNFRCLECKETFSTVDELENHKKLCDTDEQTPKRVVKKSKNVECTTCKKTFFDSSTLNRHKRLHSDEKPHFCDICDRPFNQIYNMKIHRNTHLDPEKKLILSVAVKSMKVSP